MAQKFSGNKLLQFIYVNYLHQKVDFAISGRKGG